MSNYIPDIISQASTVHCILGNNFKKKSEIISS